MRIFFSRANMVALLNNGNELEASYAAAKEINPAKTPWFHLFWKYLHVAYANWHFYWLRHQPSRPATIHKFAFVEKLMRAPFSFFASNQDKKSFERDDFLVKKSTVDVDAVKELESFLHSQEKYYDVYDASYEQVGLHAPNGPNIVYVKTTDFARTEAFWQIVTTPTLYETCSNILGRRAKITWAWLWHSKPSETAFENQNWHRDTGEPFNFIRLFVPLNDVKDETDGPTLIVKGSTKKEVLYERRRFSDQEVTEALGKKDTIAALGDIGDFYCANTFCMHRGLPPKKPRGMLSLLVSYQNSYRTKGLPLTPLSSLNKKQQKFVLSRKHFFSEICDFNK